MPPSALLLRHQRVYSPRLLQSPQARPTAAAGVGIITHSLSEADAYAKRVDAGVESLYHDMRTRSVYASPTAIRATANALPDTTFHAKVKADLLAEAARLEVREAGRSDVQIAAEIAFGRDYTAFYHNWKTWYRDAQDNWHFTATLWDTIEVYDSQYRAHYKRFRDVLKIKPSSPEILTNEEIDKQHPGKLTNLVGSVPWVTIALIAVGGLVAYTLLTKSGGSAGGGGGGGGGPEHVRTPRLAAHTGQGSGVVHDAEFEPA